MGYEVPGHLMDCDMLWARTSTAFWGWRRRSQFPSVQVRAVQTHDCLISGKNRELSGEVRDAYSIKKGDLEAPLIVAQTLTPCCIRLP